MRVLWVVFGVALAGMAPSVWIAAGAYGYYHGGWLALVGAIALSFPIVLGMTGAGMYFLETSK